MIYTIGALPLAGGGEARPGAAAARIVSSRLAVPAAKAAPVASSLRDAIKPKFKVRPMFTGGGESAASPSSEASPGGDAVDAGPEAIDDGAMVPFTGGSPGAPTNGANLDARFAAPSTTTSGGTVKGASGAVKSSVGVSAEAPDFVWYAALAVAIAGGAYVLYSRRKK